MLELGRGLAYGTFLLFFGWWGTRHDPAQMAERSQGGSNVKAWDKVILRVCSALLLVMLVVAGLPGYREYAQQVRYCLLPGVW